MAPDTSIPDGCGFVFAATGEKYITLSRRAARSLREIHPDAEIDFFTDAELNDPVFSRIHHLEESWFRPKMEALYRSRFERTVILDADVMVAASLEPIFRVLEKFDLAVCHDRNQNTEFVTNQHTRPMPHAFATLNGGVVAIRRSDHTRAFMLEWQEAVKSSGAKQDQPSFRELLFYSDLRICVLPPGYNLMTFHELKTWWGMFGAPRILHSPFLYKRREGPGDPEKPFSLSEMLGPLNVSRFRALVHADRMLTPDADMATRNMYWALEPAPLRWLRSRIKPIYRNLRYRNWW